MPARSERILTLRELNRATLARQLLLGRERLPTGRAVERLGGLQAQEPAAPFIALWSRLEDLDTASVRAAVERRALVKATLMRGTLHLVSAADWAHFQPLLAALWARQRHATPAETMERATEAVLAATRTPQPQGVLRAIAGDAGANVRDGHWWKTRGRMPLLHAPAEGSQENPWCYGVRPRLKGAPAALRRRLADPQTGARRLVARHLGGFGPATVADIVAWSGLSAATIRDAVAGLGSRIIHLRTDEGEQLVDLRGAPLPDADIPAPPRFLSMWDSVLLAFRDRRRIFPAEFAKTVVSPQGDFRPTFIVDGVVAGMWRTRDGRVELLPFAPLPTRARRELESEARRLEAWLASRDPNVFRRYTSTLT